MRSFYHILLVGLFIFCSSPVYADRTVGLVRATCNSSGAILEVAKADSISVKRAGQVFTAYIRAGVCGSLSVPMMMELETKIHEYKDVGGVNTEVWKIKNFDHWIIVASSFVSTIPSKEEKSDISA